MSSFSAERISNSIRNWQNQAFCVTSEQWTIMPRPEKFLDSPRIRNWDPPPSLALAWSKIEHEKWGESFSARSFPIVFLPLRRPLFVDSRRTPLLNWTPDFVFISRFLWLPRDRAKWRDENIIRTPPLPPSQGAAPLYEMSTKAVHSKCSFPVSQNRLGTQDSLEARNCSVNSKSVEKVTEIAQKLGQNDEYSGETEKNRQKLQNSSYSEPHWRFATPSRRMLVRI